MSKRKILITGAAGFIGGNLCHYWREHYPDDQIIALDALTYASNYKYLQSLMEKPEEMVEMESFVDVVRKPFVFVHGDILVRKSLHTLLDLLEPDHVIHLAAESHVCNSIKDPTPFYMTNIMGTAELLEACRGLWGSDAAKHRFHHVSTDEVFGELRPTDPPFSESTQIKPRSPYAASKASSDHLVQCYHHTYGLNTIITNCSNNFGPNQHEEKLIPKTIKAMLKGETMTVYGQGTQVRDWLYVNDHCYAIDVAFHKGIAGERYCIGGELERTNLDIMELVRSKMQAVTGRSFALKYAHTDGRPTDDLRYAIDNSKIRSLGWAPSNLTDFQIEETIRWYYETKDWHP